MKKKIIIGGAFLLTVLCSCELPLTSKTSEENSISHSTENPTVTGTSESFVTSNGTTTSWAGTSSDTSDVVDSSTSNGGRISSAGSSTSSGGISSAGSSTSNGGISSVGGTSSTSSGGGQTGEEPADTYLGTYYNSVSDSLRGDALKSALSTVTSAGFVNKSYSAMWDIYPDTDVSGGKMILFYTATPLSYSAGSTTSKSNKEHVWPQSWYGSGSGTTSSGSPGADIHNIFPCDGQLNNVRSSSAFDILPYSSPKVYERGSSGTYGEGGGGNLNYATSGDNDSYNYTNTGKTIFYPKEGYRGITARTLMYVATRYYNDSRYPVELVDVAQTSAQTGSYGRIGKLSTLLKWHLEEPVSDFEIARNQTIFEKYHKNRNPFVDKPSYACRIFGDYNSNTQDACNSYTEPADDTAPLDALIGDRLVKGKKMLLIELVYLPKEDKELLNYKK